MKKKFLLLPFLLLIGLVFSHCKSDSKSPTTTEQTNPTPKPNQAEQLADNQQTKKEQTTADEKKTPPPLEPQKKEQTKQKAKTKNKATPKPKQKTPAPKKTVVTPQPLPPPVPKKAEKKVEKKAQKPSFKIPPFDNANGKIVYNKTCHTCHNMGIAGAPAIQGDTKDKKRWLVIAKKNINTLSKHVKDGYSGDNGSMPPGMCIGCADKDFKDVIYYMIKKGIN